MIRRAWFGIIVIVIILFGCFDGGGGGSTNFIVSGQNILETGQTDSFDGNGIEVFDGSIKDDGYYRMGTSRSHTRDDDDIVTDLVTELMWEDDINASMNLKSWVTLSNFDLGNYDDTGGETAASYCRDLVIGDYDDWRLPSVYELLTAVHYGQDDAKIDTIFENVVAGDYWTATSNEYNVSMAWMVDFASGVHYAVSKSSVAHVRCVRGTSIKAHVYTRDPMQNVVTDDTLRLQWQDDSDVSADATDWENALERCEALVKAGYDDWRLPNINELISITDYTTDGSNLNGVFENGASDDYWSSTSGGDGATDTAHAVNYGDLWSGLGDKTDSHFYVRCVRGGQ